MFDVFTLFKVFIPNIMFNYGILELIRFSIITLNSLSAIYAHIPIIGQNIAKFG